MPCEDTKYGCVFCRTGWEKVVAIVLQQVNPGFDFTSLSQVKHKSENGIKKTQEKPLFPGYVFLRTEDGNGMLKDVHQIPNIIRLLLNTSGQWTLLGEDRHFAKWVFDHNGLIGVSVAHRVGDRIVIHSGPLKDYEGQIVKIDRRSRNGLVEFRVFNQVWKIWLAFELLEETGS